MFAECCELFLVLSPVSRLEERSILHARVDRVWMGQRRFDMPHAHELPWARCAVVKEMSSRGRRIRELVTRRFPRPAPVIRPLQHLPKPGAGLRRIDTVGIGGRALQVVDLPTGKMGTADIPVLSRPVRSQNEPAFARSDQHTYSAHRLLLRRTSRSALRLSRRTSRSALLT